RVAGEHLHPVEDDGVQAATREPSLRAHVVPVRPDADLRIVVSEGEGEVVEEPAAGDRIARLRDRDTLMRRWRREAGRVGELADQPAIGEIVVDDNRIAVVSGRARPGKARG